MDKTEVVEVERKQVLVNNVSRTLPLERDRHNLIQKEDRRSLGILPMSVPLDSYPNPLHLYRLVHLELLELELVPKQAEDRQSNSWVLGVVLQVQRQASLEGEVP